MRFFRNKLSSVWLGGLGLVLTFWIALTGSSTIQNALARIDTLIFDGYQQAKPRQWGGSPVVVLDIDEASLAALGQWPWPRTTLAKLTRRLGELGAAVTVFDMVFAEQDRTSVALSIERLRTAGVSVTLPATLDRDAVDHDQIFAKAIAEHRVVTGMVLASGSAVPPKPKAGTALSGNFPEAQKGAVMTAVRNLDLFDAAALGVGDFSFETRRQADAVVRYAPLLRPGNGQFYPSLAVEALRVAQGAGAFVLKMSDGSGEVSGGRSAVVSVRVGALTIPTHEDGSLLIYHSRASSKPVFSAARLLAQQPSREETAKLRRAVEGRIVLVGTSAAGLLDLRATPIEPVVPGVSIHADIIDQVLSGAYLTRPDWILGLEWFVAVVGVLILLATLPFLGAVAGTLLVMVLIAGSVAGFWFLFAQQALVGSPLLASASLSLSFVGATAANLLITERQRHRVRTAFGRYLSPTMVERLANQPDELTLGGEEKELTLLFCDIRGFTSLSEGLQPTELTELLNRFLTPMTTALLERGATIDKYMGDAIMAFWNAPLPQDDHRQLACEGLMAMREALVALNATLPKPIAIGIGLNSGPCCVGNLGSNQRFSYSAIGDAVNVASRVEGQTKQYGLDNLVAAETLLGVEGFIALEVDRLQVVGRDEPLTVWTLLARTDALRDFEAAFQDVQTAHQAMLDGFRHGDVTGGQEAVSAAREQASRLVERGAPVPDLTALYDLYQARLDHLALEGVPADWDGIYRATSK